MIVLTNDDGVKAPGIQKMKDALRRAGLDVVVVAPATNQSGVSGAATYAQPVRVRRSREDPSEFAVTGTPVDCIRVALVGQVFPEASLVISGINHGANLGDDIHNSGTFAAALEAAHHGVPALAVSQQSHPGHFHILDALDQTALIYDDTAELAAELARTCLERATTGRYVLNVNAPAEIPFHDVEVTRLGARRYQRASLAPVARTQDAEYYLPYGAPEDDSPDYENTPGTDFHALERRCVSITPLSYDYAAGEATVTDVAKVLADVGRDWIAARP